MKERVKPVNATRSELRMGISHELEEQFRRVQDLLSQKMGKHASLENALETMIQEFLERNDPIKKAERVTQKMNTLSVPGRMNTLEQSGIRNEVPTTSNRIPIPASLKHQIVLRDRGQCSHHNPLNQQRCSQRRWLDIHHIMPVSQGGENTLSNLITLCKEHHLRIHD